ncbi:hypothetical protein [Mycobacterium lepromatosis]|uniref:hypothetical protein n=1 Tax=Mycobacterium lepromatosis TaxID=480418 RepID=UPI000678BBF3
MDTTFGTGPHQRVTELVTGVSLQVGVRVARMSGQCSQRRTYCGETTRQLAGEQQVGEPSTGRKPARRRDGGDSGMLEGRSGQFQRRERTPP